MNARCTAGDVQVAQFVPMGKTWGILVVGALALVACSSDDSSSNTTAAAVTDTAAPATDPAVPATDAAPSTDAAPATDAPTTTVEAGPVETEADAETLAAITNALDEAPAGCDPLDERSCLLPFPSNAYRVDGRVALPAEGTPVNAGGVGIDPAEWNRNDGFSPNAPMLTYIAGLDPDASNLPPWTDLARSLDDDATVVLIDADTGERVPLWAELDAHAASGDDRLLEIHPAISLPEGHSFVVGLRGLMTVSGDPVEPSPTFRAYRDRLTTDIDTIEARRDSMETVFDVLAGEGVAREDLQLAWDFTVATTENISGRMLAIRDDALAELGDAAPVYMVSAVTEAPEDGIAFRIEGTYTVPNYLTDPAGGPGSRFFYGGADLAADPDALPVRNGTLQAPFACNVSDATVAATEPAHLVAYGHGLLGSHLEINAGNVRAFANESNIVFCATKWAGMSEDDIGNAAATLGEFSNFPTMADRLQQGLLNQIFLGRLMTAADGIVQLQELTRADGSPMIDTSHLDYDGNSQGGIMGMALAAVSPDIERAVLGVVGMNYSTLLARSVDFADYEAIMVPAYPNDLDRTLILALVQMLWDRGEGAGYVQHLTADPLPGTPAKDVLLDVAFGDWQVSELTAMVAARTMGVPIARPVTDRSLEVDPGWGLDSIEFPSDGSGLIIWDSGSDPIPLDNMPPSTSRDPHADPRNDPDVRTQKAAFLFDDTLIDVCGEEACTAEAGD